MLQPGLRLNYGLTLAAPTCPNESLLVLPNSKWSEHLCHRQLTTVCVLASQHAAPDIFEWPTVTIAGYVKVRVTPYYGWAHSIFRYSVGMILLVYLVSTLPPLFSQPFAKQDSHAILVSLTK